jgi:hypothetical protein
MVKNLSKKLTSFLISFSLVLWEIINHKIPYHDINPEEVKTQVLNGMHPQPKEINGTPVKYQKIMEKGWDQSPKQRPTIEKMLDILDKLERKERTWSKISRIGDVDNSDDASSISTKSSEPDEVGIQYIPKYLKLLN